MLSCRSGSASTSGMSTSTSSSETSSCTPSAETVDVSAGWFCGRREGSSGLGRFDPTDGPAVDVGLKKALGVRLALPFDSKRELWRGGAEIEVVFAEYAGCLEELMRAEMEVTVSPESPGLTPVDGASWDSMMGSVSSCASGLGEPS